jgi:hypothetical protein
MIHHAPEIDLILASPVLASQRVVRTPTDLTVYAVSPGEDKSVTLKPIATVHHGTDQRYRMDYPALPVELPKRMSIRGPVGSRQ